MLRKGKYVRKSMDASVRPNDNPDTGWASHKIVIKDRDGGTRTVGFAASSESAEAAAAQLRAQGFVAE